MDTNNTNIGGDSENINNLVPNAPKMNTSNEKESSAGPIAGSIIVIVIIILGGLYFLNQRTSDVDDSGPTGDQIRLEGDEATLDLATQNESDEVDDIEADLDATSLEDLDKELGDIDAELSF
jgi:hypothetical protein